MYIFEFTFFIAFHHKKYLQFTIIFAGEDQDLPHPPEAGTCHLRIGNSKIYFEPYASEKNDGGYLDYVLQGLKEELHFDPSYIGKPLMLWFTYNLTQTTTIIPTSDGSQKRDIEIKGVIKMTLNNDNLQLNYIVNFKQSFLKNYFIHDFSKINSFGLSIDAIVNKLGFVKKELDLTSKERTTCLLYEIENELYLK